MEDLDVYAFRKGLPRWCAPLALLVYPNTWPIPVYRFGAWIISLRSAWLRRPLFLIYFVLKRVIEVLTTIDISERAEIGGGLFLAHIGNIVIGHSSRIGHHASIHQGVTIGGEGSGGKYPVIGDLAYIGAGAKIVGPVSLGNRVVIGANAVVVKDAPDDAILGGIPAKILSRRGSTEFIHFRDKDRYLLEITGTSPASIPTT